MLYTCVPPSLSSLYSMSILNKKDSGVHVLCNVLDFPGLKNVSSSEGEPSSSSTSNLKVDIESLLQKLVAAGIINTKPDEDAVEETLDTPVPETPDTKEASEHSEEIPVIGLTAENLKV